MSTFHNSKDLWDFITGEMAKKADIKTIYSQSCFFTDLKRSNEELYMNGILIDPILNQARNQIHVATRAVESICTAVVKLSKHPDNIEEASEIIASMEELGTDSFETALLNASELIESPPDSFGKAFRSFCAIRSLILSLQRRVHSQEQREEKYSQIKDQLDRVAKLKIEISKIETRFLDKAANEIFNRLFENKEKTELKSDFEQYRSEREINRKECLERFLKLFLHQNFLFPNINLLNKLGQEDYVFISPSKRTVDLSYNDNGLFLQVSFFTQKVLDCNTNEVLETQDEDFFVKGVAQYKINIRSYNETGWVVKFDLIGSSLECKEEFKAILDKRSIFEKFQEYLVTWVKKIIAGMTSNLSVSTPKTKFKPIFFVSNSGSSVSKIIADNNTESYGNILALMIVLYNIRFSI